MYQTIRYEKNGNIGIATINRPEALNALNSTVISELEQLISEVEKDAKLGAFIITGEGRSFVAGADIGEQLPLDVAGGRKWGQRGSALMRRIEKLEIPTIDGRVKYTIPEGTQTGTVFRLRGKGIPVLNGRGRGDQYVTVTIETPRDLNREQKEALKKFSETLGEGNYEKHRSFFGKKK